MWRVAGVVAGAVAIAAACEVVAVADLPAAAGDAAAGAALLGAGALTAGGARGRHCGVLMVLGGIAWLAGTLSGALVFVHRGPLVQLVLAHPRARPLGALAIVVTGAAYVCGASGTLARNTGVTLALSAMVLLAAAARHRATVGTQHRAAAAALAAACVLALGFSVPAIARSLGGGVDAAALWVYDGAVVLVALGLAADLRWGRWTSAAVAELVADLGSLQGPDGLRERLARALGDPDLVLAFGATPPAGFAPGRVVCDIVDDGRRVGVLVHDPAVTDDPQLLGAAISVARLAAANTRLQREVADAVGEVAASRRRLVEATIEQRRRLEAELRDGPERRLAGTADRLDRLAAAGELPQLVEVTSGLARARDELHSFAQGVHPRALTEVGLAAALEEIADAMPLPVHLDVLVDRHAPNAEAAAYFLCAEALANVGKHAHATSVTIAVRHDDTGLDVAISDDGAGGADPSRGSGLRGLADRIHALDGDFEVDSHDGRGTRLHARIPL